MRNTDVIESYNRHPQEWAKLRSQSLFERAWLDKFLSLMPENPRILDLGCGTGQPIAGYLIERGAQLTGVDGASNLIDIARASLPKGRWLTADIRGLDLGARFDGILGWNSTFHLSHDEQRAMFQTFQNHAKKDTALMFTSGPEFGETTGQFAGEPISYSSLSSDEYRALLQAHGWHSPNKKARV